MLAEAQQRRQSVIAELETERASLDATITQLRAFEKDYRGRLRGFIEGQLNQLTAAGSVVPDEPNGHAASGEQDSDQQVEAPEGHDGGESGQQHEGESHEHAQPEHAHHG